MDFQTGVFEKYRATAKIHLGPVGTDLFEESVIEFDGSTLKMGGKEYNMPVLRGAVIKGWLVPVADNVSRYIPQPAGVRVRPAQGDKEAATMAVETTEDEQAVGTLTASNDRRAAALVANTPSLKTPGVTVTQSEEAPEEIDYGLGNPVAQAAPAHPTTGKVAMKVVQDDQDATPVARFGNPAVQKVILSDGSQAAREIGKLDGGRVTKVEKLATKAPSQTVITEGTSIKETSGGTTGDVTEMHTGDTLEALLPDALVAGASLPKFDWDKSIHWRKRVAAALAYADKPETLKQIFACEEPSVVKHVKSEMERKGLVIPA